MAIEERPHLDPRGPFLRLVLLVLVGALAAIVPFGAASAREKPPEVTHDGLHLKEHSKLRLVYTKPGSSLEPYDKIMILDCFVSFKKNWQRDHDFESRISKNQMEKVKKHLADEFRKVFTKELQEKGGYAVVTDSGPDVLLVRPAIINLVIEAPDAMSAGRNASFSASAGEMTLYIELYDSATSDIIVRAIDPEAGRTAGGFVQWQNGVTNKAEADQILRKWADVLRKRLDEAHGK
jgi:hypothetical protein